MRWQHPTRGAVPPLQFIGIAEDRGLIDALGAFVLREAGRFWAAGAPWVAVNVSPIQLRNAGFLALVIRTLEETGLQANRLQLEITESVLLEDIDGIQGVLRTCASMACGWCLTISAPATHR